MVVLPEVELQETNDFFQYFMVFGLEYAEILVQSVFCGKVWIRKVEFVELALLFFGRFGWHVTGSMKNLALHYHCLLSADESSSIISFIGVIRGKGKNSVYLTGVKVINLKPPMWFICHHLDDLVGKTSNILLEKYWMGDRTMLAAHFVGTSIFIFQPLFFEK